MDMNPGREPGTGALGLPFTVVMRAVESGVKKVLPIPLRGPVGGLLCWRAKGRRASKGEMPVKGSNLAQLIPARAPVWATQTVKRVEEAAMEVGN